MQAFVWHNISNMHGREVPASVADGNGLLVSELNAGVSQALVLVDIAPGREREEDKIDGAGHGEQPVGVVELIYGQTLE